MAAMYEWMSKKFELLKSSGWGRRTHLKTMESHNLGGPIVIVISHVSAAWKNNDWAAYKWLNLYTLRKKDLNILCYTLTRSVNKFHYVTYIYTKWES